jgi:C4-dicarboxylate-specific signal transduction histidine kinase
MEYRLRRKDGQYRWLLDNGVPRHDSQQNFAGYIGSCVDVTERRHAEAEAQCARQELVHMGRVSTLGELAGSLAHELNQPLTSILSNAQAGQRFLKGTPADQQELRSILEDIIEADRRAGEVIFRMRTMLKKGEAKMLPIDLNLVARGVLALVHSELVARNISIITHLAKGLPLVRGDRVQLQQLMLNLIMNSCDALNTKSRSKHQLTIETQRWDPERVKVAITDTGPGFPAEMLERPFEPFRTTKANGLGLGLPICRSIVSAHGGQIWLSNSDGGGARACFALPTKGRDPA